MDRLPPGQKWVQSLPVLHHGEAPRVVLKEWSFFTRGLVRNPLNLSWEEFLRLPRTRVTADFHCVTRWSVMDVEWEGVLFKDIAGLSVPEREARFVMVHSLGGFSANLPLEAAMSDDVVFATRMNGEPLSSAHGWPVRLVVPSRYAWKSAKWVAGVEFMACDRPGFWESRGYHNDGDPWEEQRYS